MSRIGVMGLAVMGQNLALNIADKGFVVSGMFIASCISSMILLVVLPRVPCIVPLHPTCVEHEF